MRAYIEKNRLVINTVSKEIEFDEPITNVVRAAFREEFLRSDEWLEYVRKAMP